MSPPNRTTTTRKTLHHKCRSYRNTSLPTRNRTLPPLPNDFNIDVIQKHSCYKIWTAMKNGEILKRYGTTFKKGDDHSQQRLIRRINSQINATRKKVSGKDSMKDKAMIFKCTELPDSDESTPVSPPNIYIGKKFSPTDVLASRIHYRSLDLQNKTKRKYVKGALYTKIMFKATELFDVRRFKSSFTFDIETNNVQQKNTVMKVCDLSSYTELLSNIVRLNNALPKTFSICRKSSDTGDCGVMHVFGKKTRNTYYASMNNPSSNEHLSKLNTFVTLSRPIIKSMFPEEFQEIQISDMTQDVDIHESLGGMENGISAFVTITRNLRNSSHYDDDNSKSIIIFTEKYPGESTDWYFLFPNLVRYNQKHKAIAIKLFHGCAISFDAKLLRHCTVFGSPGRKDNEVYGNLFGSKCFKD